MKNLVRETIVSNIIWLKEDLQISSTCGAIRDQLLDYLRDEKLFSPLQTAYFDPAIAIPYRMHPPIDPPKIAVIKKIMNALDAAEKGFKAIENVNVNDDRYVLGLLYDLQKTVRAEAHQLYGVVNLLNETGADVQAIMSPYLSTLIPKLHQLSEGLESHKPSNVIDTTAKALGSVVNALPTAIHSGPQTLDNLCKLYFELPSHLENLQRLIATGASTLVVKSTTSAKDYQAEMLKKANATKKTFESLISANNNLTALPSYFSALKKLVDHSVDLVSTAAPLTKQAYLDAADILNKIRHEIAPQLVTELEEVEENLGLRPNILVSPVMTQLDAYYKQLAEYVDGLAQAAGVVDAGLDKTHVKLGLKILGYHPDVGEKVAPIAHLDVLRDDEFEAYITAKATKRLVLAQFEAKDKRQLFAAKIFFKEIEKLKPYTNLADAAPEVKEKLLNNYKQFQHHLAALYPDVDQLIVTQLTMHDEPGLLATLSWPLKYLWDGNNCKSVLDCKQPVYAAIERTMAQAAFEATLIQAGSEAMANDLYVARGPQTALSVTKKPFKALDVHLESSSSSVFYGNKRTEFDIQLNQLQSAKTGLNAFFNYLLEQPPHDSPNVSELPHEEKEVLRKAYKKFQPHLVAQQPDAQLEQEQLSLNRKIVDALSLVENNAPLQIRDLLPMKETLAKTLDELIGQSSEASKAYTRLEKVAREHELSAIALMPRGTELMKKTLFRQICDLNLSNAIQDFIDTQYRVFLQNEDNMEPEDHTNIDPSNAPFTDFYEDSPDIIMHKQILNTLHYLKAGFLNIETLDKGGDPGYLFNLTYSRRNYLWDVLGLVGNLADIQSTLKDASQNPGLAVLMNEGLKLLEPLKKIPMVAEYLKSGAVFFQEESTLDIVAAWEKEQRIVIRNRVAPHVLHEEDTEDELSDPMTEFPEEYSEDEYRDCIEPEESPEENTGIISNVLNTPMNDTDYLHKIAEQLYRIPQQLNAVDSGVDPDAERCIEENVQAFVAKFKGLSYGPGSMKQVLLAIQEMNTQLTGIAKVSGDLVKKQVTLLPKMFGEKILSIVDTAEFNMGLKKPGALSKKLEETFNDFYWSLIETLHFEKDQQGLQLIVDSGVAIVRERIANETKRLHQLNKARVFFEEKLRMSVFGKLALFEPLKGNIVSHDDQIKFLKAYEQIQPILKKIDIKYDRASFLRTLQKPGDFNQAIQEILGLDSKLELERYVVAATHTREKEIARCAKRLAYFNEQLKIEQSLALDKVTAFKNKVFENYLNANVASQFEKALGLYTEPFMKNISVKFVERQADILAGIGMNDDIELLVAARIDDIIKEGLLRPLMSAYEGLNTSLKRLALSIEIEESLAGENPCRQEKLGVLRAEALRLSELTSNAEMSVEAIVDHKAKADFLLDNVNEYNAMIKIYDLLDDMKVYLEVHQDTNSAAKIAEIDALQNLLKADKKPRERWQDLEARGTSHESKNILLQNADNVFVKMLKSLWSFITGWENKDHKASMFHKFLHHVRNDHLSEENPTPEVTPMNGSILAA